MVFRVTGKKFRATPWINALRVALLVILALFAQPRPAWPQASPPRDGSMVSHGVILMYHRFGETNFPSTSIRLEQLEAHIRELKSGPYTVLPVLQILRAVRRGEKLPPHTVGLTIDDGYLSIHAEAWPRLRKAGLPFSVFVTTESTDKGIAGRLSWDQIREMVADGVEIGAHTATHLHMVDSDPDKVRNELRQSAERFRSELGRVPAMFAYPYGETSLAVVQMVVGAGYEFGLGQHSGVVNKTSDFYYLPRFALNERWGTLNRFRQVINALPLPLTELTPQDPLIGAVNPPTLGFTLDRSIKNIDRLKCYPSHGGKARIQRLGAWRIEVRLDKPFTPGRTRINCTLFEGDGRFRWFGTLFYLPKK